MSLAEKALKSAFKKEEPKRSLKEDALNEILEDAFKAAKGDDSGAFREAMKEAIALGRLDLDAES